VVSVLAIGPLPVNTTLLNDLGFSIHSCGVFLIFILLHIYR
jgi:hypothetical protein